MNKPLWYIRSISTFFVVAMGVERAVKTSNTRPAMFTVVTGQEAADALARA